MVVFFLPNLFLFADNADNNDDRDFLKTLFLIIIGGAAIFFAIKIITLLLVVGYFILVLGSPIVALILSVASFCNKIKIKVRIRKVKAEVQQINLELGKLNSLSISYEKRLESGEQN